MSHVYKIMPRAEWIAAQDARCFKGSAADLRDGYIHLSTAEQAAETARLHFAGQDGLILLRISVEPLGERLRWEPSRGGRLFPHLYGPLDPAEVAAAQPLELNVEGWPDPGPLEA
ncbi:DUF952 domain-containing protein [Caulobacter sp. S45]|uniref:DUF952 domain-containing protein n=1 Tax=Caulobacter sp. S45 TaxID=1641861 RepID=UPI0015754049|nr:DUF952 domain-containing protein [Caulobacter sp. S45]